MKMRTAILVTTVTFLLLGGMALAQSSADASAILSTGFDLRWHVIAGGGGHASSAGYVLDGSIGQPAVGALDSASYRLGAGYWYGVAAPVPPPPPAYKIYLPIVLKNYP